MIDLGAATKQLSDLVAAVRDNQLDAPTPCPEMTVATLLDHINGLALAFTCAAAKTEPPGGSQPPAASAERLSADWRDEIPRRLDELAAAWRDPDAWSGMTKAGGIDLPGEIAGLVALDEVLVHGWDLGAAIGQSPDIDDELVAAATQFVQAAVTQNPQGTPGLFGAPVEVSPDAPALDRLLGLTGRDPDWSPR